MHLVSSDGASLHRSISGIFHENAVIVMIYDVNEVLISHL